MPLDDRRRPRRQLLLLAIAYLITILGFGAPLVAYAAPTPTPSPSDTASPKTADTPSAKVTASDQTSADQKSADATPEPSSTPTPSPSAETPTVKAPAAKTPAAKAPAAADPAPSDTPSSDASSSASPSSEPKADARASSDPTASDSPSASAKDDAADASDGTDGPIIAQVVPPPTNSTSVVSVKVGGDRTGVQGVQPLQGVTLGLYTTETGNNQVTTCVSDADGDCNFVVTGTGTGGGNPNRGDTFWVRPVSVPSGWYENPTLRTGSSSAAQTQATPYRFETPRLFGGNTYTSGVDFMLGTGNTNRIASGGIWQQSRNNPTFPAQCGIDVALILDLSGSVGGAVTNLRNAANAFADALVGTPSRMSLFSFSDDSPANNASQNYPALSSVSTQAQANAFKARYASWGTGGGTNWDRGLASAAAAPDTPDIAVIITDGNPTRYSSPPEGPASFNRIREVENGIFSANALKNEGTRVMAFGVGAGASGSATALNLRAISGQTAFNGSNGEQADYYQTPDYESAADALKLLAQGNCTGTISVIKEVIPTSTPPGDITGAQPTGGWRFDAAGGAGVTITPPSSRVTASQTGAVNFPLSFAAGTSSGPVTLTETQQTGYTLQQVNGLNAVCVRTDTQASVPVTNDGALGFRVNAATAYPVSCTVYNRAPTPRATVQLNKRWSINGTTYPEGQQPAQFVAQGTIDGTDQNWGDPRGGFTVGDTVTLDERVDTGALPPLCSVTSQRLTSANGATVDAALPATPTLEDSENTYTITNAITCETKLTLVKVVRGGPEAPTSWNLEAAAPSGALPGPNGITGTPLTTGVDVTPGVRYTLSETEGNPVYTPDIDPNANLIPGANASWNCVEVGQDGSTVIPGYADGLNGGVNVPLGKWVRCTVFNDTARLELRKVVENTHGGTAVPADWDLTATPEFNGTPPVPTPDPITVTGSDQYQAINIRPDTTYRLTESTGPSGYSLADLLCTVEDGPPTAADTITLQPLQTAQCTFRNVDSPAQLTLVKNVVNNNGGTAAPADWQLEADGPTPISGDGNSPDVTNQTVDAGSYTLSESGGPSGYTASDWTCTGGAVTGGDTVAVPTGGNVTCTITNTDQPAQLTLVKTVTNDNGGTASPTEWTLSAQGPTPITGVTGTAAVTDALVDAGQYALTESGGPSGYTASVWSCTGGTVVGNVVTVPTGGDVSCTINNDDQPAYLTLIKVVDNGTSGATYGPGDWQLVASGPTPISGDGNSPDVTNQTVDAGSYSLSESSGPSGYTASDWTCSGGAVTGGDTVTVPNGGNVSCTITNTVDQPTLTLVKVVDDAGAGGTAAPADWTLSAAGPSTVIGDGNSPEVTDQPVQVGNYALAESGGPDGYTAGAWTCTGAESFSAVGVTIAPGNHAVCTITNTAVAPTLTLVKVVDNQDTGASTPASAWTLTAGKLPPGTPLSISGVTGSPEVTNATVQVGAYGLTESGPAGYDASDWVCTGAAASTEDTVTLELDQDATCTITNTAQQPHLTLVKTVTNDNGGTAQPTDWTLTADGPTAGISGPAGDPTVTNVAVQIGDYNLAENSGPDGYTPGDWSCEGGSLNGATVTVALGDDVTCTINNDDQPAQLTLVKTVDNGNTGGTATPTDWNLSATGPTPISGVTGTTDVTAATVDAGDYTLSESGGPSGYDASAWTCTGATATDATVTVPNGGDVTCTITNTAQQPHLTLVKTVTNDNGGTAQPTDWTLTADGPTAGISGPAGDPTVTNVAVQIGDYNLAENSGPDGYTPGDWSCVGGNLSGSTVSVALGDDVTCTINNDDQPPSWSIVKGSDPDSGATVQPGDEITYVVGLLRNPGIDPTNVAVTDDLSQVLNNATLVDGPYATTGTALITGTTMTWDVPVLTEDVELVTYTVRVNDDAYGVTLKNVATSQGSSPCVPEPDNQPASLTSFSQSSPVNGTAVSKVRAAATGNEECPTSTEHYTPAWELTKTSNPAAGSTVPVGSTITYTLTATNTTQNADLSGAVATDDLSDVLNHATLVSVPDGATLNGTTLTWQVPDLAPGQSAELTYQVRLDADAYDATVTNVATPAQGGTCPPGACTTSHHTPNKPVPPIQPNLPNTGGPSLAFLGIGLALLIGGAGLMLWSRRRRAH